ncbi:MAG: mucoidy inhibitor MuiA family protein, partial [Firmicutes bacterium]|nr:mucoidy inhibitor MuiA family protein [Bacillota bacterium]
MAEAKQKVTETEIKKAKAVLAAIGNEQEIDIKQSKIQDVTLFLSGAEITRSLKVNLEEGTNKIYINGFVKDQIIAQSISAEFLDGQDSARIYAVDYKTALVLDREASSTSKEVREKSQNAADELLKLEQELKVLEGEEKLLSSTNSTELKIADIKELSKFFNTRMTEIASIRLKIVKRQRELNDLVKTLEYQTKRSIDTTLVYQGQIGIEVYSAKKQTVNLKLVYSISGNKGASWQPIYNLKVNQTDQKTTSKLALRAVIKQETNEDWSDVKLTLSSSQLTLGVKEPTLKPWYMYAYDASSPRRMMKEKASFSMEKFSVKREEVDYEFFDSAPEERVRSNSVEANVQRETAVNENALSVSYQLYGEQTIISGIQKTIDVTEQDITATFNYYAVPKLNTSVYYMMHIE